MKKQKLTSVKIDESLYDEFKIEGYKLKMTFGDFVHKALYLFINDPDFKNKVKNQKLL